MATNSASSLVHREFFIFDASVSNLSTLTSALPTNSDYFVLDATRDGVAQIADLLAGQTDIDSLHIFSHGSAGLLLLGNTSLSLNNLNNYALPLSQIGSALSPTGDILLYGCNVGDGDAGRAFVDALAALTGADVAASDDIAGATEKNYLLLDEDVEHLIQVVASYTDDSAKPETAISFSKEILPAQEGDTLITLLHLDAPTGASIINPLTTLLKNAIDLGISPNIASQTIKTVLGIPATVQLQSYDAYEVLLSNPNDTVALTVEKIAVQVAILTSLSDDDSGMNLTLAILNAANANQTYDLATLDDVCTILGLDPLGTLPDSVAIIVDRNSSIVSALNDGGNVTDIEKEWVDFCSNQDDVASNSIADLSIHLNQSPQGSATFVLPEVVQEQDYLLTSNDLLQGFTDPDGDALSVAIVTADAGSVQDNADGTWLFTPTAGYVGPVELTYTVQDGKGASIEASQMLVVAAASDATPPTLVSATPFDNATGVAVSSDIVLTFSENVQAGSGNIVISNGTDVRTIAVNDSSQVTFDGATVTINPTTDLQDGSDYHVEMASGVIKDLADNTFAGISDSGALDFTVYNQPPTITSFNSAVTTTNENTIVEITFAELLSHSNASDADGTVEAFVVKNVSNGTLRIGSDAATATPYNGSTNNTIDPTHNAFWTPALNLNGALNAFAVVAKDNMDKESILPTTAISVSVDGRSGPWDVLLNPLYPYGSNTNGQNNINNAPTVVDNTSGLSMTAGDTLTITYESGLALAGADGSLWFDANGVPNLYASVLSAPGYYLPENQKPANLEVLMGVFALDGVIVGDPFKIGNGPTTLTIPNGSNQLLLGFSDGWFNDNGGAIKVSVTESSPMVYASVDVIPANTAPTFMVGDGIVTTDLLSPDFSPSEDRAFSLVLQPDGKIIVGGGQHLGYGNGFGLVRYNSDGTLDTTFDGDGKLIDSISGYQANSVALQPDGKIIAAGIGGISSEDFVLVRYNSDGSLDTSFDGDGRVIIDKAGTQECYSVILQPDGKIIAAGGWYDFVLIRFNSDGSFDTSFDGDGEVTTNFYSSYDGYGEITSSEIVYSVVLQSDGKILAAGSTAYPDGKNNGYDFALARYNSDGSLDMSFGSGGTVITDFGSNSYGASYDYSQSITIQADGKIIVAGYTMKHMYGSNNFQNYEFALARYNSDGSLDTSFGDDGKVTTNFGANQYRIQEGQSVTVQADGKILVAGSVVFSIEQNSSYGRFALVRYNSDGSLDTSFDGDGMVITNIGIDDWAYSATIQPDGKILVAGKSSLINGIEWDFALVRYNSDGSLDQTFNPHINTLDGHPIYTEHGSAVVLDSDVQIYDAELAGGDNYGGATLTLARNGGASADDHFSGAGIIAGQSSGTVTVAGTDVGSYTWINGALTLTFNTHATQALVNQTMQSLAYENVNYAPPSSVQIDWTFSDGESSDALSTTGSTTVTVNTDATHHNLTGNITFWKTGEAITDVTTTLTALPTNGTHAIELKNIHVKADGSHTVEVWATTSNSTIGSFECEFVLPTGATATWQAANGLPKDWIVNANPTASGGSYLVGGMAGTSLTPLAQGAIKLGTLTISESTPSSQFELVMATGMVGDDTVEGFGIVSDSVNTGNDNYYHYINIADSSYALTADKVAGAREASSVHVNDALAALKMAVELNPNNDGSTVLPFQYLAADINHDGKVRANDAFNILKMALDAPSAQADEWIFVDESVAGKSMDRSHVDWSDVAPSINLNADTQVDLIGIVKGDVDGSWGMVG